MNNNDQVFRAVAILTGIKENLPNNQSVSQRWVNELHSAVNKIEDSLGSKLDEFKIEDSAIRKRIISSNYLTGDVQYSEDSFCDSRIIMQKIDSLLKYLNILLQPPAPPEKKIGFQT